MNLIKLLCMMLVANHYYVSGTIFQHTVHGVTGF